MLRTRSAIVIGTLFLMATTANAGMVISEWLYSGQSLEGAGEYIEFTNISIAPVDMTGWSFDDDSRTAGTVDLSAFGLVAPGESVILAEADDASFRTEWGLDVSVKIIGGNSTNLGRNDEINLYDENDTLIDRLTYGDQNFPETIRTQNISGNPLTLEAMGLGLVSDEDPGAKVAQWVLSDAGDKYGSYVSNDFDFGNPGVNAIPEPASFALFALGLAAVAMTRGFRRR
jgi:hypothetical protein